MTTNTDYPPTHMANDFSVVEAQVCVACGGSSYFSVGWLVPTPKDAKAETSDKRPCCSYECAITVVTR